MRILDKIDEFIDKINERKKYSNYDELLEAKRKVGGREYDEFFTKMLKKWKIKSYKDLPKEKQKEFFDAIDKGWNAKKETD